MPITKVKVEFADVLELMRQRGFKSLDKPIEWFEHKLTKFDEEFPSDFPALDKEGEPDNRLKGVLIDILAGVEEDADFEILGFPDKEANGATNGKKRGRKKKTESAEQEEAKPAPEPPKPLTEEEKQAIMERYACDEPKFEFYPEFSTTQAVEFLEANFRNRPMRSSITERYAEMFLTRKWGKTLEPVIFDADGIMASGQHRCTGLIKAESIRSGDPEVYQEKYGWEGPITAPMAVVYGADPDAVDYMDRGQQRTGGDVLFRRSEFDEAKYKERDLQRLSADLAIAARLCWIRTGEKQISDAPHFPHSEMIKFIEENLALKEFVEYVYALDAGTERKISKWLSRGAMAALGYLFAASATECDENGVYQSVDLSMREKAEAFIAEFATGTFTTEDAPIHQLREWFSRTQSGGSVVGRGPKLDVKVYMVIKTWQAYVADGTMTAKSFKVTKRTGTNIKIGGIA